MTTSPDGQLPDAEQQAQAYQDTLIAQRLPGWLRSASIDQLSGLQVAMRRSLEARQQLQALLQRVQGIDRFAQRALHQALLDRYGADYALGKWCFIAGQRQPIINSQPVPVHLSEVVYAPLPLLEAALRNFTADQAREGGQPRGNRLTSSTEGRINPPTAVEFARLCRATDLGAQYQQHLDNVLGTAEAARHLAAAQRWNMLTEACQAQLAGVLTENELQLVIGLCQEDRLPTLQGAPVVARQLQVLGCQLEQIVVLDVVDQGWLRNTSKRVLVYIPGDPQGSWSAFDNLHQWARQLLGKRLRQPLYQAFFSRFVRRRDSQRFFAPVISGYHDLASWANIDLDERMRACPQPLFDSLAAARVRQIKDDAAVIAVPVAALDRELQREHDQRLAAQGLTLLGLAGLFVPALGAGLMAVAAWQLLDEAFHGVQAWQAGEDNEALEHLLNVAKDVAAVAVTATGVSLASRAWQRSTLVDSLVPATMEDGSSKLWRPDLQPFRSLPPPSAAIRAANGVQHLGEQSWVELDGNTYPARQRAADGRWQLLAQGGHAPLLEGNDAGAWRLWYEQPAQWQDAQHMVRRLGWQFRALDDAQVDALMSIHGLRAEHLRALHVEGLAPSAELLDSVVRARLVGQVRALVGALRQGQAIGDHTLLAQARGLPGAAGLPEPALAEQVWQYRRLLVGRLYERLQVSELAPMQALRRQFPRLHRRAAYALLRAASEAERQRLVDSGRVGLHLAEAARACSLRIRTTRVYEALHFDTPQDGDLARAVLGLLDELPGAEQGIRWRLLERDRPGVPLHEMSKGSRWFDLVHADGEFTVQDAQGAAISPAGELFETLAVAYEHQQRRALGIDEPFAEQCRALLLRQAQGRRDTVGRFFSQGARAPWFRSPQRMPDGRIGYPLSGRGTGNTPPPQGLSARLRAIYPRYTDGQVLAWLTEVQRSGLQVSDELARLSRQLQTLQGVLHEWETEPQGQALQEERNYIARALVRCWQRRTSLGARPDGEDSHYRFTLYGARPGRLPLLPAQIGFDHVVELSMAGMELSEVPDGFLHAFPNLRVLELAGNALTQLPRQLPQLTSLRELDLFNNRIVLDPGQQAALTRCASLEYINLSFNPLGRNLSVRGLGHLRRLILRSTGIGELPSGLLTRPALLLADLRGNRISVLPERFYQSPAWLRRVVMLGENPLTPAQARRWRASLASTEQEAQLVTQPEPPLTVRQRWLDAAEGVRRDELSACWETLEMEEGSADFFRMLQRLLETADYRQHSRALANRLFAMLQVMSEHADLRQALFSQAGQNLTCQDSVTLCFANLELRLLVWRAQRMAGAGDQQAALLNLGRQLWRLDEVERIALEDIRQRVAQGSNPDQVEVVLAYRLALQAVLDLPTYPGDMYFAEVAGVSAQRLEQARRQVLQAESPVSLARSLVTREFWQAHLLQLERARFDSQDVPFHEQLAALMESETVPEGERLAQMNAVRDARLQARQALMLALTRRRLGLPVQTGG